MSENDAVNHPGHYTSHPSRVECIQVTEHMSFCLGNAIKYIWRADLKGNAIEDLQKARWYVDREIARLGGDSAVLDEPVAARLEAESARDEEAERLAEDLAFAYCLGFGHDADEFKWNPGGRGHDAWLAVARQVLVLAADGRLLPEGGTGEADVKPIGWWRALELNFAAEHYGFPPLPRSSWIASDGSEWAWDERMQVWELRQYPPAEPVPDSGPDGTPEKPWPTWQDVPEGSCIGALIGMAAPPSLDG
ncbi:DUF3310 domain-containing protein [Rhodococcus hoagii]|nr:DUF3310 domain-containing protein [Prescottella equi]